MANIADLKLIQIPEFPKTDTLVGSGPEYVVLTKADGATYGMLTEDFKAFLGTVQIQVPKALAPTDPAPTLSGVYYPTVTQNEAGTPIVYANAGGIEVNTADGGEDHNSMVQLIYDGSSWVKVNVPIEVPEPDLSGVVSKSSIVSVTSSNQLFDKGDYRADTSMVSTGQLGVTSIGAETTQDIPLDLTKTHISISGLGSPTHRMAFLDEAGIPITPIPSSFAAQKIGEPIPALARKVRVYYKASAEPATVRDTLMINYGLTALPYEPYRATIKEIDGKEIFSPDLTPYAQKEEVYTKPQVDAAISTKLPKQDFEDVTVVVEGKNLFNPEDVQHGKFVNSTSGRLSNGAGWGCSGFIPVEELPNIAIQGQRGRTGQAFYTEQSDLSYVPGSYVSGTPSTLPVPPTAKFFVMNLYEPNAPEYSNIQVEAGTVPTDYEPYINGRFLDATKIFPQAGSGSVMSGIKLSMNSEDEAECYIETSLKGKVLRRGIALFRPLSPDSSQTFDFRNVYLDGVLKHGQGDNAAPYYLNGDTIGANHGFVKNRITLNAHGKTNADVGSIWTDGTKEFIIVNINDANSLDVSARLDNSTLTGNSLTHVSGATNAGAINSTTKSQLQMYPAIKNYRMSIFIDGLEVTKQTNVLYGERNVVIRENYDIMSKASIMEWLITQAGTVTKIIQYGGTSVVRVGTDYIFDNQGGCAMPTYLLGLEGSATSMQKIMFNMSQSMAGSKYYVPKTLPLTFEGNNYNFTNVTDILPVTMTDRIDFTPDRVSPTGIYADRVLMLRNDLNFAIGFLPLQDAEIAERRINASRKALQISNAKKVYMSAIDSAAISSVTKGDYFSVIAYRNYFLTETGHTAKYVVKSNAGEYLYADWHSAGMDSLELPPELSGKPFEVVEKSSNVTVLSKENTGVITVEVDGSQNYGYLIAMFKK